MKDSSNKKSRYLKEAAIGVTVLAFCSHLFLTGVVILILDGVACLLCIGWFAKVFFTRQKLQIITRSFLLFGFALFMLLYDIWGVHHYALVNAIGKGDTKDIESLIAKGYDVNADTGGGQSMLTWTFWYPYYGRNKRTEAHRSRITQEEREDKILEIVTILVEHGADVNRRDPQGETPLNRAASNGYIRVVKKLLENGADVNMSGRFGDSPLHNAVHSGSLELVELLIDKKADVNIKGRDGKTPLRLAIETGRKEIVEILRKHGAKE